MGEGARWRFGPYEVDALAHRLSRDGRPVLLPPKAFALLLELLRRPGELVTKSELFVAVWPKAVVSDAALSRAVHELRQALEDEATAPRFIATVHGLGFRFVAPLAAQGAGAGDVGRWLIGREADFARLEAALAAARQQRRRTVLVSGEAGIGKTALVEAFLDRHRRDGELWIAQGRCIEQYGATEAHLPVLEALEQLSRQAGEAFVEAFSRFAPSWLAQLPWLARQAPAANAESAAEAITPQRMLRELAHALDELSRQRVLVLWLEDLHWSDPSSLEVLAFLAGRRDASRLLLLASFRRADANEASPLQRVTQRLVQRGEAEELPLRLLHAEEVARYLGLRFGSSPALPLDALTAFVHHRTDGNALFMVAMADDLVARGELVEEHGRWRFPHGLAGLDDRLPESLRRLVHEQLERLSETDRRLVEAGAVVGTSFCAAATAAAVLSDVSSVEDRFAALAQLGRLLEAQPAVHWPDGTVSAQFRFLHVLYWQGVHERVPEGRRAEWQRRIGLRQEQAWGGQSEAIAPELAQRFEAARDIERALRYLRLAGTASLSRCAYREGIDRLRHGLALVPALPPLQRPRHELDLLLPLGAALIAAQGYASADASATYERALELCGVCGRPEELVRALRGQWNVAFLRRELPAARVAAERQLAQADALDDARMRIDAQTKLGQTCLHAGDLQGARLHLETALAAPGAEDDPAVLREAPRVAAYLAWTLWYAGLPAQALRMGETALALAARADSPHSTLFALSHVGWVHLMRGELGRVQALLSRQIALSSEYGFAYWRRYAEAIRGVLMLRQGEPDAGIAVLQEASEAMQSMGDRIGVPYLLCLLAQSQAAAGRPSDAQTSVARVAVLLEADPEALFAAEVRRTEGLVAQARDAGAAGCAEAGRCFGAALDIARRQGARSLELRAATCMAALLGRQGRPNEAVAVLAAALSGFGEGLDTEDPAQAAALLAALREQFRA